MCAVCGYVHMGGALLRKPAKGVGFLKLESLEVVNHVHIIETGNRISVLRKSSKCS